MNFQWLTMRIQEEKDRRHKVEKTLARLPDALDEVFREIDDCMKLYTGAFGPEAARMELLESKLRISIREQKDGKWQECGAVDVFGEDCGGDVRCEAGVGGVRLGTGCGGDADRSGEEDDAEQGECGELGDGWALSGSEQSFDAHGEGSSVGSESECG